jgi:hypothetical protein
MNVAKNIISVLLAIIGGTIGFCAMGRNAVTDFFYTGHNARWVEKGGLVALLLLCTALILVFLRSDRPASAEPPAAESESKPAEPEQSGE